MPEDDLIASPEAADILGVSASTVHRLANSGDLPVAQKIRAGRSGTFLFHRSAVWAFKAQRDAGSTAS